MATTFKNPLLGWKYGGAFSIELTSEGKDELPDTLPTGVEVQNNLIIIKVGWIQQGISAMDFHVYSDCISISNALIMCIRNNVGQLLWVNDKHREEITDERPC